MDCQVFRLKDPKRSNERDTIMAYKRKWKDAGITLDFDQFKNLSPDVLVWDKDTGKPVLVGFLWGWPYHPLMNAFGRKRFNLAEKTEDVEHIPFLAFDKYQTNII